MKILKRIFLVLGIVIVAFLIYFFVELENAFQGMSDNRFRYSKSIMESEKNNLFIGYYRLLKDSLTLGGHNHQVSAVDDTPFNDSLGFNSLQVKSEKIWYEKNWRTERKKTKIYPGINIIVPYISLISSKLKIEAYIKERTPACKDCNYCMGGDSILGFTYSLDNNPDTLVLIFRTNYPDAGYEDTIKYVKE